MLGVKRHRRTRGGTAGLIVLFVLVSAAPLAILTFSSVHLSSDAVVKDAKARVDQIADLSAAIVQEDLQGLSGVVSSFAEGPSLTRAVSDALHYVRDEIQKHLEAILAAHPDLDTAFIAAPPG